MSRRDGILRLIGRDKPEIAVEQRIETVIAQADRARDAGNAAQAASLYEEALKRDPRPDLYVQLGNMRKDAGQLQEAYDAYSAALEHLKARGHEGADPSKNASVADLWCQLGHLFKLAGQRDQAVAYYRKAFLTDPKEYYLNEAKVAETVVNTIPESVTKLMTRPETEVAETNQFADLVLGAGALGRKKLDELRQCVCWSKNFRRLDRRQPFGLYRCRSCGSDVLDTVTVANSVGLEIEFDPVTVDVSEVELVLGHLGISAAKGSIAIVGAQCANANSLGEEVTFLTLSNRGLVGVDLKKCQFDIVVMWQFARRASDVYRLVDQAFAVAKPGGYVCFVYEIAVNESLSAEWQQVSPWSSRDQCGDAEHPWLRLSTGTMGRALRLAERDGVVETKVWDCETNAAFAARKSRRMSVAVMSGIGDNVWSLVFAKALASKFGDASLEFVIHDSGDARRKRSNGMMTRFGIVDGIATQKFTVHSEPAIDEASGHLRYVPSGQVPLASEEPFDYRLIVNTFLEHGHSVERICKYLKLDPRKVDFDFFKDYTTLPRDWLAVRKVQSLAGSDYVVFYYGALIDNTDGGLNRGGLWSANDWNTLGRLIHAEYGCKVVIIGAGYDLEYARCVQAQTEDLFYVNTIGQLEIAETLSVINGAKFIVSFPAGVGIVAPYMRVPSVIFWRPKELSYHIMHERAGFEPAFATNWVPPTVLSAGLYYPAWYGTDTPQTIFGEIGRRGWFHRKPSDRIGAWATGL